MNTSVLEEYQNFVAQNAGRENDRQEAVVAELDVLRKALARPRQRRLWFVKKKLAHGAYLYGSVGSGKTTLMDLFLKTQPEGSYQRMHFHQFMQYLDAELRKRQGQINPLDAIARHILKKWRILAIDEFMVHDVGHALILATLFPMLMQGGMVVLMTSNISPDDLYQGGVQRDRFLPVIALIKEHLSVMTLNHETDFRLGRQNCLQAWFLTPTGSNAFNALWHSCYPNAESDVLLSVQEREFPVAWLTERALRCDFNILCALPRSQLDYLELADRMDVLFIDNLSQKMLSNTAQAYLFSQLIDVWYDRHRWLCIASDTDLDVLTVPDELGSTFVRTRSRLHEMQSMTYQNACAFLK